MSLCVSSRLYRGQGTNQPVALVAQENCKVVPTPFVVPPSGGNSAGKPAEAGTTNDFADLLPVAQENCKVVPVERGRRRLPGNGSILLGFSAAISSVPLPRPIDGCQRTAAFSTWPARGCRVVGRASGTCHPRVAGLVCKTRNGCGTGGVQVKLVPVGGTHLAYSCTVQHVGS